MSRPPHWQLPAGVSRGTWDYVRSEHIARDYDHYFQDDPLLRLDIEFIKRYLPPCADSLRPVVADLGCGTGRVARQITPIGYRVVNVDLSQPMLEHALREATCGDVKYADQIAYLRLNLTQLSALRGSILDMAVCLFSSIGMIQGRQNRVSFLSEVRRCLKAAAPVVVHVHNRYQNCWNSARASWLLRSRIASLVTRDGEFGDRVNFYRGLPSMFLHIYSRREIKADLRRAGFSKIAVFPIDGPNANLLPGNSLFQALRAGGYFAVAWSPSHS